MQKACSSISRRRTARATWARNERTSARVSNRKHHAIAKAVVILPVILGDDQPRRQQPIRCLGRLAELVEYIAPAVRRVTDPEAPGRGMDWSRASISGRSAERSCCSVGSAFMSKSHERPGGSLTFIFQPSTSAVCEAPLRQKSALWGTPVVSPVA